MALTRWAVAVLGAVVGAVLLAGCGVAALPVIDGAGGSAPPRPMTKPALALLTPTGHPFDIASGTAGKVTLVYFGYTHCPDVCPETMGDLAIALESVPAKVRGKVAVVFVSTDPARDTGVLLHRWLRQFDPTFIGLRGPLNKIRAVARSLSVPLDAPARGPDGQYTVVHGASVTAFGADGRALAVYPAGTSVDEWVHDLQVLVRTAA